MPALAKELGVTMRLLYKLLDAGELPAYRFGRVIRVKRADVDAFLEEHLGRFAVPGVDDLVFVGPKGGMMRRCNFSLKWAKARRSVGMEQLHFHDLRHTANTLAAATGASTRS